MVPLVANAALLLVTISLFVATLRLRPKARAPQAVRVNTDDAATK
jgi:hypothetical protein